MRELPHVPLPPFGHPLPRKERARALDACGPPPSFLRGRVADRPGEGGARRFLTTIVLLLTLTACTKSYLPFEKPAPLQGKRAELVNPPWEAYVKAGPGAEKDIDFETLDGPAQPVAEPAPPLEVDPLPKEEVVAVAQSPKKPESKKKGIVVSSVAVPLVQGPGGRELSTAMRIILKKAGWPVVNAPREDALTIRGSVKLSKASAGQQNVRLIWSVLTPDGKNLGDVTQNNMVPAGSLDQGWGDNARYASEGAAEGIFKLIEKYR
jgi:hypothetical protein